MAILGDTKATSLVVSGTSTLASINANSTGLGTNGQILKSTGTGIVWADAAGTHNHDGAYVNITGDTMTGALIIKKTTAGTNTYNDANPKIIFQNSNASQNASLTFTDYDTVQSPASLTLNGNQGGEYFIAPNIKATSNFYGSGANLTSLNASNLASGTVPIARIPTGTSGTTVALGNHTHNYAGSSSAGGAATSLANFKVTTSTNLWAVDSPTTNAIGYQSGLTKANWNYQQQDGAIYDQFYSSSWIHQIYGDYRTGQISVRGKNNGTWQAWRRVLDETNASTILGLGTLATKSTIADHSYTPAGTIALTNGNTTTTVSAASSGATTYTPGGSVSVSTNATTNKTATVSVASSGDATYTPSGTNSAPGFTGTAATLTHTFTGTAATIVVSGATATGSNITYTPAGTIQVSGTTSTATVVKTATFNTVVTSATVANEILTISTGAAGSSTNQTGVRTADPAYTFSGTGARLTASYTPAGSIGNHSYTPSGSVAAPVFTGTPVRLVTGNIAVPNTYTATFSGTAVRLVTGNISRPTSATFTGTPATLSHTVS